MTTAFETLQTAYRRASGVEPGAGAGLVGVVGADVPDELLHAAGLRPLRLRGAPGEPTPLADRYVEQAVDPAARSVFDRILNGTYAGLDRLVLCHDCEATVRLFYYLRELRRIEPERGLPELCFVDVLHRPARTSTVYNIDRMAAFRDEVARWTGTVLDEQAVRDAVARCNERRRLLQRLAHLRRRVPPALSGAEALAVVGAGMVMDVAEYLPLLRALCDERSDTGRDGSAVRLYVTGTAHDHTGLYEAVEGSGAVIVGENHDRGDLWAETLVDEEAEPMRALAVRYQHGAPASAGASIDRRARHTADAAVSAGAAGVLCFLRRGDNAPYWDVPEQRRLLAAAGIPMLVIDMDTYQPGLSGEQRDAVRSFVAELADAAAGPGRGAGPGRVAYRQVRP
ncbi:MAG: 2-hydroxyacyl-CoA dehydratase subunit D [Jiangellaceae bacterium]